MPTLDEIFAAAAAAPAPVTKPYEANYHQREARADATQANRIAKREAHAEVLAACDGDSEALKTITLWEPRKRTEQMFFRAFDRKMLSETGNAFHDEQIEVETTEYKLVEVEVPRARHPDEERAFAKLQNRFRESKPSILGFFHKPTTKHGDRRQRRVLPAPLGDFNWVDANPEVIREQQLAQSLAKLRSARPIRNVKESAC